MQPPVLVVFSHLRWGFVFQRPQHLLSRLAGRWRILFVEEPKRGGGQARLEVREVKPGLTVLVPHTPVNAAGFHDDQIVAVELLLRKHLEKHDLHVDAAWLYTPMALPLAHALNAGCLVYDCMDELSAFLGAPRQLRQRESALMQQAALVLTGGPSLYEARKHLHPNIHCFCSSVDADHFSPASLDSGSALAQRARELQGDLARPRLGFFGVIDERLDIGLVDAVAERHPEWQLVMVGPVAKIDPASLPKRANIRWLGMQPYELLPYLLAGWDVALMPFALNESTRFISPTKTLEYMAGYQPVVSTPIRDVESLYSPTVITAPASEGFIEACEQLLDEDSQARSLRLIEMAKLVARHSWHDTAEAVHRLLAQAVQAAPGASRRGLTAPAQEAVMEVQTLSVVPAAARA
ncbi:MAG: glycosyltransferase family 1 protein [Rubrivivax sp.]|nr:MAG: glycosyltransferase family 1 protein [Rubrivivax sp.]